MVQKIKSDIHVRLTDHLLYHPSCEQTDEGLKLKYIPQSPRNRLMYYHCAENMYPGALKATISHLLKLDVSNENIFGFDVPEEEPHPTKHRKYATHVLKVSPNMLCDNIEVSFNTVKHSNDQNRNFSSTFSQQLITDGIIQWCKHNQDQDTVIMSDYSPSTGNLYPLSYVHVTCTTTQTHGEGIFLKCTCQIYNTIQCAGLSGIDLSEGEDVVLDISITCMHCRFFKDYLLKYRRNLYNITQSSIIDTKIRDSLPLINNPVIVVSVAQQNSTTKLSVVHDDTVALIRITFNQSNSCFEKCQNGMCAARMQNKKKIISIQQSEYVCGHLQTLFANFEIVNELFPDYFGANESPEANDDNCDANQDFTQEMGANDINMEDQLLQRVPQDDHQNFDVDSGLWNITARSKHKPKDMNDLELARYIFNILLN